jgi:hypothetical protein
MYMASRSNGPFPAIGHEQHMKINESSLRVDHGRGWQFTGLTQKSFNNDDTAIGTHCAAAVIQDTWME